MNLVPRGDGVEGKGALDRGFIRRSHLACGEGSCQTWSWFYITCAYYPPHARRLSLPSFLFQRLKIPARGKSAP